MVLAYHVIFCAYGFWLPNDPRGSWSEVVWAWELRRFGEATKTTTRRSVAAKAHDRDLRLAAKRALKYPAVSFTDAMIGAVARGFADYVTRGGVTVHACSILPEHVHMVIARHRLTIEKVADQLRAAATREMNRSGCHPLIGYVDARGRTPKPWADGEWKVFLNDPAEIARAIRYVERNPMKEGRPRQSFPFVASPR